MQAVSTSILYLQMGPCEHRYIYTEAHARAEKFAENLADDVGAHTTQTFRVRQDYMSCHSQEIYMAMRFGTITEFFN